MKFFVSLLIGLLGVVAAPARAQSDNPDMTVEVLGVYFTPPANAAAHAGQHDHAVLAKAVAHGTVKQLH